MPICEVRKVTARLVPQAQRSSQLVRQSAHADLVSDHLRHLLLSASAPELAVADLRCGGVYTRELKHADKPDFHRSVYSCILAGLARRIALPGSTGHTLSGSPPVGFVA